MALKQESLEDNIAPHEKKVRSPVGLDHLVPPDSPAVSCCPGSTLCAADVFRGHEQAHVWGRRPAHGVGALQALVCGASPHQGGM